MYFSVRENKQNSTHTIVVPHKVISSAVKRNKTKRRIRHILAQYDIQPKIVIINKDITELSHEQLTQYLKESIQKKQ